VPSTIIEVAISAAIEVTASAPFFFLNIFLLFGGLFNF
jgi:hypothetical protein